MFFFSLKMKMGGINEDLMPSKNKYLELKEKIKEDYYKVFYFFCLQFSFSIKKSLVN